MIKMIVFDMAGTTINENNVVYKTVMRSINEAGFDFNLDEVLIHGAGKEKMQAIRDILKTRDILDQDLTDAIYKRFMLLLSEAYTTLEILPMDGAEELFSFLKQRKVLVVLNTGYDRKTAQTILDKLKWNEGEQIDALVTASDVPSNRPDPDMIDFAMKRFDIWDASTVAKVGDSVIDIEEGKNASCGVTIGVTTGAHTRLQLEAAQPSFILDHLLQIESLNLF